MSESAQIFLTESNSIMAFADDVNRFTESDETNNKLTQSITIGPAPTDLNGDGQTTVVDVQLAVNQVLTGPCTNADVNKDGACNVVDVQQIVNKALGL